MVVIDSSKDVIILDYKRNYRLIDFINTIKSQSKS
jgi:hypothetical protein